MTVLSGVYVLVLCMVRVLAHYLRRRVDLASLPSTDLCHLKLNSGFIIM